jgi:hypothetical protein
MTGRDRAHLMRRSADIIARDYRELALCYVELSASTRDPFVVG